MLELLQASHRLGGAELARRLGVDERTVRRYADRLSELGIPVTAERGRYGGYRLMPGYKLPPLMFTDDEAAAVVLGLLAAGRLGLPGADTASALAKVQRVLPAALGSRIEALRQTLGFTMRPADAAAPDIGTVLALAQAAGQRQRVRLRYRSWNGADSERDLDPYGLVLHSGRWYVTGHDSRSGQIRTFRVDRVMSLQPGRETFEPPADFDPVRQVLGSLAAVPYAHEVEVVLGTTMEAARRRIPPSVATLTEAGDGVLLRARAEHLEGFAVMLAGLGCPFTIREPASLRDEVRALAGRLRAWSEPEAGERALGPWAGCLPGIQCGEEGVEDFAECGGLLDPWDVATVLDHRGAAVREQAGDRDDGAGACEHVLRAGDDQDRRAHLTQPTCQVGRRVAGEEGASRGERIPAGARVFLRCFVPRRVAQRRDGLLPGVECLVAAGVRSGVHGGCCRRERRLCHAGGRQRGGVGGHVDQVGRRRGDQHERGQAAGVLGGVGDRQAGSRRVRDHRAPVQVQAGT